MNFFDFINSKEYADYYSNLNEEQKKFEDRKREMVLRQLDRLANALEDEIIRRKIKTKPDTERSKR